MLVSYHRSKLIDQKTSQKTGHIRQNIKKGAYYTEREEPKMKKRIEANRRKETIISNRWSKLVNGNIKKKHQQTQQDPSKRSKEQGYVICKSRIGWNPIEASQGQSETRFKPVIEK